MSIHDESGKSDGNQDDGLNDDRISTLYRQLPDAEPSAATDALVRAAARRAVNAGPRKTVFTAHTQRLLATAATLVLGVSLLVQWQSEPENLQDVLATAPPASHSAPPEEGVPASPVADPARESFGHGDNADTLLAGSAPEKPEPARSRAAAPTVKFTGESVQESALAGATAKRPDAQAVPAPAPVLRAETEERQDQAAQYLADRDDSSRKAKENSNNLRMKSEAAAKLMATAPSAVASAAPEPLKKQASSDSAAQEMKADFPAVKLLAYQQAMQAGDWALAQKTIPAPAQSDPVSLQIDRDLLASVQGSRQRPACAALPDAVIGRESLICHFLILHAEGRTVPTDIMQQLERAKLITGALEYRDTPVRALRKQ